GDERAGTDNLPASAAHGEVDDNRHRDAGHEHDGGHRARRYHGLAHGESPVSTVDLVEPLLLGAVATEHLHHLVALEGLLGDVGDVAHAPLDSGAGVAKALAQRVD